MGQHGCKPTGGLGTLGPARQKSPPRQVTLESPPTRKRDMRPRPPPWHAHTQQKAAVGWWRDTQRMSGPPPPCAFIRCPPPSWKAIWNSGRRRGCIHNPDLATTLAKIWVQKASICEQTNFLQELEEADNSEATQEFCREVGLELGPPERPASPGPPSSTGPTEASDPDLETRGANGSGWAFMVANSPLAKPRTLYTAEDKWGEGERRRRARQPQGWLNSEMLASPTREPDDHQIEHGAGPATLPHLLPDLDSPSERLLATWSDGPATHENSPPDEGGGAEAKGPAIPSPRPVPEPLRPPPPLMTVLRGPAIPMAQSPEITDSTVTPAKAHEERGPASPDLPVSDQDGKAGAD